MGSAALACILLLTSLVSFFTLSVKFFTAFLFPHRALDAPSRSFGGQDSSLSLGVACYAFSGTLSISLALCGLVLLDAPLSLWKAVLALLHLNVHSILPGLLLYGSFCECKLASSLAGLLTVAVMVLAYAGSALLIGGAAMQRVCLLGVIIIGGLSGYGAVSIPSQLLAPMGPLASDSDVSHSSSREHLELPEILNLIAQRKMDRSMLINNNRRRECEIEISSLEKLCQEIFLEQCDHESRGRSGRHRGGPCLVNMVARRSRLIAGIIMAGCCCVKFWSSIRNVWKGQSSPQASTVSTLLGLAERGGFEDAQRAWGQLASFAFISVLVFMQARSFLVTAVGLARGSGSSWGGQSALHPPAPMATILFSLVAGVYFLSSIMLLSPQLPESQQQHLAAASGLDSAAVQQLKSAFDLVFAAAVAACFILVAAAGPASIR
jgi:hypothetical protein